MIMSASEGSKIRAQIGRRKFQRKFYTFVPIHQDKRRKRQSRHRSGLRISALLQHCRSSAWSTLLGGGMVTWLGSWAVNQRDRWAGQRVYWLATVALKTCMAGVATWRAYICPCGS